MDFAAVAALAESPEVRRHLAVRNTGVYIVRQDGHIVWASPSMLEVTGRDPKDLVGCNGWDVFVAQEDLQAVMRFKVQLTATDGVLWMCDRKGDGRWYRIDTWVREGYIFCAFHVERDPAEQHLHFTPVPRRL